MNKNLLNYEPAATRQVFREVNPYKKVATFFKLFLSTLVDQGVHHFLIIFEKHIVK